MPVVGIPILAVILVVQLQSLLQKENTRLLPIYDFVEYWAAGRLNAEGSNPWSPQQVLALQKDGAGWYEPWPVMMWNPPWTLTLVMPFGLCDFLTGRLLWLLLHIAIVMGCAVLLWRIYAPAPLAASGEADEQGQRAARWLWLAVVVSLAFYPSLNAFQQGQIGPVVLLGLTGFIWLERQQRHAWAGAVAALAAVKPHLVYLFWLALLLQCLYRRQWGVFLGGIAAGVVATAIPLLCNPQVLTQYREALSYEPEPAPEAPGKVPTAEFRRLNDWQSPTPGTLLRLVFGPEKFWLQFVPTIAGILWFLPYWYWNKDSWVWSERLPLVLLVSVLTAAYGSWPYDLVVLVIPLLQVLEGLLASGRRAWLAGALGLILVVDGVCLMMSTCEQFFWLAPTLFLAYLGWQSLSKPKPVACASG